MDIHWLLENSKDGVIIYVDLVQDKSTWRFTREATEAMKFATQEEANQFREDYIGALCKFRAVEHAFMEDKA